MHEINFNEFRKGETYYIDNLDGPNYIPLKHSGKFSHYHTKTLAVFTHIKNMPNSLSHVSEKDGDGYRNTRWRFYKPTIPDIEKQRENRTINMVLQNILNDEWFIY